MVMHGPGGQERRKRHAVGPDLAVGENHERISLIGRHFGLGANPVEGLGKAALAFAAGPGDVDQAPRIC